MAIWKFSQYSEIFLYFPHDFSRNHQRYSVEHWLGNTVLTSDAKPIMLYMFQTLFQSSYAIERKDLLCFTFMEDSRTCVSVMRAAVNYSAETASGEMWFTCEVNVFLLRVCYY
jgi:hypothetical protein